MRIERERFLRAGHYERSSERRGYANGSKPKKLGTPAGQPSWHGPEILLRVSRIRAATGHLRTFGAHSDESGHRFRRESGH